MYLFPCLTKHLEQKKPFAIYSKANADQIIGVFQRTFDLYTTTDFKDSGFVFAPFSKGPSVLIPAAESIVIQESFEALSTAESTDWPTAEGTPEQQAFEALVERGLKGIAEQQFEKVVLSRQEIVPLDTLDVVLLFKKLKSSYPTAFCSIFYHPEVGLWMGATPEQLLRVSNGKLFTMALAGTQVNHGKTEVFWGQKEQEEQRYVTDFILDSLTPFVCDIQVTAPFTARAGKVMHIRTDVTAAMNNEANLADILDVLHPTPAVCGMPKAAARTFIEAEEGYERAYYAGFLGELNYNFETKEVDQTDLFVNLRCMQLEAQRALLYLGCGITDGSDATAEFYETVNKSTTMKKILK